MGVDRDKKYKTPRSTRRKEDSGEKEPTIWDHMRLPKNLGLPTSTTKFIQRDERQYVRKKDKTVDEEPMFGTRIKKIKLPKNLGLPTSTTKFIDREKKHYVRKREKTEREEPGMSVDRGGSRPNPRPRKPKGSRQVGFEVMNILYLWHINVRRTGSRT